MLPVAAAWSRSDDNAIRFVLPVFWMTSCLPIIWAIWCVDKAVVPCQNKIILKNFSVLF